MVGVDVGILDLHQVHDHFLGRSQALVEDTLHHVKDAGLKLVEVLQFWNLDLDYNAAELFVNFLCTVK